MVNDTIALALELAYITATLASWLFLTTPIPIYLIRSTHMKMPPTTGTFATITYSRGGYRHTETGWFTRHETRIIKHTYQGGEDSRRVCYTDELLDWKPVTRR